MKINNESTILMVEKNELEELIQKAITDLIPTLNVGRQDNKSVGNYIPQSEAMKLLNRKTTWFHLKRKSGELPAKKSGNQWWYRREDIEAFIENGNVSS
jgi:hypothetical protein